MKISVKQEIKSEGWALKICVPKFIWKSPCVGTINSRSLNCSRKEPEINFSAKYCSNILFGSTPTLELEKVVIAFSHVFVKFSFCVQNATKFLVISRAVTT